MAPRSAEPGTAWLNQGPDFRMRARAGCLGRGLRCSIIFLLFYTLTTTTLQAAGPADSSTKPWQYRFGGYFRSLFSASRSIFTGERYGDGLNRIRLSADGAYGKAFTFHFDLDNEIHVGNLIGMPDFGLVRARQAGEYFDLLLNPVDEKYFYWDASVYRGEATLRHGSALLTLGRQRIAWGTARFFSPADVFNPLNPLQVEGDVRQGVDAAQLNWYLSGESNLSLVYAPQNGFDRSTSALRLKTTVHNYDVAVFAGRFAEDWMGGGDFAGQWGGAGLRGEFTLRSRHAIPGPNVFRMSVGCDYAFPNTFYLIGEYFYNQGQPAGPGPVEPATLLRFSDEIFTLHRHFLSLGATYDITPLVRAQTYAVIDLVGQSVFLNPIITWNLRQNTDLAAGAQFFSSSPGGEFQSLHNLLYVELTWHF
jgi:hypothetical protein